MTTAVDRIGGVGSGYVACACRDCFEIAIGTPGKTLCWECKESGCEPCDCVDPADPRAGHRCPHGECRAPGAYDEEVTP